MRRQLLVALIVSFVIPSVAQELPMDYSYCGYHRSEQPIPSAKVATYVQPSGSDDAATLQAAIDWVSRQKPDKTTGLRGAVLLVEGTFTLSEPLRIRTNGVVLRGSGRNKTILRKTGYDRGALIYIEGTHNIVIKDTLNVADTPVGSLTCSVQGANIPSVGSRIAIWRPSTQQWLESLNCQSFGGGKRMGYWAWHPGDIDLYWHRQVTAVKGNEFTLDAPITMTIEDRWGGAKAIVYEQLGLVSECGIENLSLESDYN
ncbi:MAG: pectate lyase, partial [Prevotella sp.]|nr:pectate lyase [Prevotella sp.]